LISVANLTVSAIVSRVSPGRPRMKVAVDRDPRSWQSLVKRRAMSMRMPFLMLLRICWLPTHSDQHKRRPLSFITFRVS